MIQTKEIPKLSKGCPRCGSTRIYTTDEEFICLACSYIVVRPELEMQKPARKQRKRKMRNN